MPDVGGSGCGRRRCGRRGGRGDCGGGGFGHAAEIRAPLVQGLGEAGLETENLEVDFDYNVQSFPSHRSRDFAMFCFASSPALLGQ